MRIPLPPGEPLLWYRISAVLGRGRSGFTYVARDLTLDREVVIKECLPEGIAARSEGSAVRPLAAGEEVCAEARRAFIAAAHGVAIAKGAHLVGMLNAFEANGTAYAVMEREEGTDLAELAHSGPLSAGQLLAIAEGILGALERLHRAGVIHGDVKPVNLRVGPGPTAVLVDFGVAAPPGGRHPNAALQFGPNPYAPMELYYEDPELRGPWTDVYGLAGAFYTVVTGRTPAPALDRSHAVLQGAPDPLEPAVRAAAAAYPAEFLQAIDHGLGFTPTQRPMSVAAYRDELVRAACGKDQAQLPLAPIYRDRGGPGPPRRKRRRPYPLTGVILAIVVGVAGYWPTVLWDEPPAPEGDPTASTPAPSAAPRESRAGPRSSDAAPARPGNLVTGPDALGREAEAADLLAAAEIDLKADRLVLPQGENALAKYEAVLRQEPEHPRAREGKERILARLLELAGASSEAGSWEQAETYLDQAVRAAAGSEAVARERETLRGRRLEAERERIATEVRLAEGRHLFEKLVALSWEAIDGGNWPRAEAYLTPAASIPGASEAELDRLRDVLAARKAEEAQRGREAQRAEGARRRARELAERVARAMDEGEWNRAEAHLDELASRSPRSAQLARLRNELSSRRAPEPPAGPPDGHADHGDLPGPAATVAILEAAPTRALVRPGDTIEFYTRFNLVPPPGRPDAQVEATWVLKRDGRSLGQPGATTAFAKAGIGTLSTALTLPVGTAPGRYTVEHRIETESGRDDSASSQFSVAPR
ncbi:MAG: protein kinase domain-containing protein [Gammaproteobacteria bacterium]